MFRFRLQAFRLVATTQQFSATGIAYLPLSGRGHRLGALKRSWKLFSSESHPIRAR